MKKTLILIVNAIIMAAILAFVVLYSRFESRNAYQRQIEYYENTTVTMESVTENYLEGEQRICDVWARYINNKGMNMEEAADYIRISHVLANTSAHLIRSEVSPPARNRARPMTMAFPTNGWISLRMWAGSLKSGNQSTLPVLIPIP